MIHKIDFRIILCFGILAGAVAMYLTLKFKGWLK